MKILVVSGGTGGHVFPALAAVQELATEHEVTLLLDTRGMRYYQHSTCAQATHYTMPLISLSMSKFKLAINLMRVFFKSIYIICKHKPSVAIGFGNISTITPLMCCRIMSPFFKTKIAVHEQNAILGRANSFLSRYVDVVCSNYPISERFTRIKTPVRHHKHTMHKSQTEHPQRLKILVLGGSQGAHAFDEIIPKAILMLPHELQARIELYQQTNSIATLKKIFFEKKITCELQNFFHDVISLINQADIIICRAGASSLAEVVANPRACILIPLPSSAENHQLHNAMFFASRNGAFCVNQNSPDVSEKIAEHILFFSDPHNREQYAQAMSQALEDAPYITLSQLCESFKEGGR